MFHTFNYRYLPSFIVVGSICLLTACVDNQHANSTSTNGTTSTLINNKEEKIAEYIIVLNNRVKISDAINVFEKYDVQVIKDLKRDRYVIGLKNDPGIEQLQKDIVDSNQIKHIQPNFIYTTQ